MEDDGSVPQGPPLGLPQLTAGMKAASIGQQQPLAASPPAADTNVVLVEPMARLADGQQQQATQFAAIQQTLMQRR
jgi:hypothetical protein